MSPVKGLQVGSVACPALLAWPEDLISPAAPLEVEWFGDIRRSWPSSSGVRGAGGRRRGHGKHGVDPEGGPASSLRHARLDTIRTTASMTSTFYITHSR